MSTTEPTSATPAQVTDLGWAFPTMAARSRHYFRADERSLCRKYGLHYRPAGDPVLGSAPDECTTCRAKLDKDGER